MHPQGTARFLRWLGTSAILLTRRLLIRIGAHVKRMDAYVRQKIMDNLDALVSVALVLGLILGTLLLTAVLCIQVRVGYSQLLKWVGDAW